MNLERQESQNQRRFISHAPESTIIDFNHFSADSKNTIDCLIILDCKPDQKLLTCAVNSCQNILLADGGANHFYQSPHRDSQKVKYIIGDLDGIDPKIKQYYEHSKIKVKLWKVVDQNHTDFQKCIQKAKQFGFKTIVCLGAFGGRLDHTILSMHLLNKYAKINPQLRLILLGDNNIMLLLQPNTKNILKISKQTSRKGCGLFTFDKVDHVETKGLKWNMGAIYDYHKLQWHTFISTSNQIVQDQVHIQNSHECIFICSFKDSK